MTLFGRRLRRDLTGPAAAAGLIPPRAGVGRNGAVTVTADTALRHSAVWACLRLRADLVSTFPVDVFRKVDGIQVEMPKPPVLVDPGGERWDYIDWMYATQVDLDRTGNTIGLITEVNGAGLPARIDLQPIGDCSIQERKDSGLKYRIGTTLYDPDKVWHERQYVVAGLPVGLSPVAYAAMSIGQYQSAQQFALDWYAGGTVPRAQLRNTDLEVVDQGVADAAKARFRAAVDGNGLFVTGKSWEYKPVQAEVAGSEWLAAQQYGVGDIARFFSCPGDLIDAAVSTGHITYASIAQRNLEFLILHLGPVVVRRERALSRLLPRPRFVKLNTSALLRMDDETRAKVIDQRIQSRTLTISEARALDNLPPLTDAQLAEFVAVFGPPGKAASTPSKSGAPAGAAGHDVSAVST